MKEGALFVNIGRGNAVDQDALKKALQSGHLAGAAIDVATPEPLPESDPLWEAPNLLVTPHVSGGYHAQSTWDAIIAISCRNLAHFIKGNPSKYCRQGDGLSQIDAIFWDFPAKFADQSMI